MFDPRNDLARLLAGLEPHEEWPSNAALGGSLTGTRDDEYRDGMLEQADEILASQWMATVRAEAIRDLARQCYNGAADKFQEFYDRGFGQWLHTEADLIEYMPQSIQK